MPEGCRVYAAHDALPAVSYGRPINIMTDALRSAVSG